MTVIMKEGKRRIRYRTIEAAINDLLRRKKKGGDGNGEEEGSGKNR